MSEAMAAIERAVRFGIKINKNEEDSNKRVTYLYDAAGMIPAVMDFVEGKFNYGSWGGVEFVKNNYPCMVKFDGAEDYRLNPDNYELKEDGTKSDITDIYYAGNAMSAFKGGWLCQYETATDEYIIWSNVKYDAAYNAYHRTGKDGTLNAGFYRHIYTPSLVGNVARSLSGCQTIGDMTAEQENEVCKANGDKWAMPELEYMHHIPNGGKRDKRTAVALKRQGVKAGVPDICLPVARNGYHGLYIELKAGKNKATKSQEKWQKFLNSQGYYAVICYGWHEAAKVIEEYLLKADNDKAAAVLQEMESEE